MSLSSPSLISTVSPTVYLEMALVSVRFKAAVLKISSMSFVDSSQSKPHNLHPMYLEPVSNNLVRMDVHESAENNLVTATFELPGMRKEDVGIDVHNNRLVVSGEATFSDESNKNGWVVRERRRGKFSRSLPLPATIQVSIPVYSLQY